MKKNVKKNFKQNKTIEDINASRTGGQNALKGYSYQILYSCYLIISLESKNSSFRLEGIEDIDCITCENAKNVITHIQLKYSSKQQDASFFKDILKNFLEIYLADQSRFFKLVYDFPVADGNLRKLFDSRLDNKSRGYWKEIISSIKKEKCSWNWKEFDFDSFLSKISYERVEKEFLETKIENALIEKFNIYTDNLTLYANSIQVFCLKKMTQRDNVEFNEIQNLIQEVKIDISRGPHNPAHSWIQKITFSSESNIIDYSFFEGKKATPKDIVLQLPASRTVIEKEITKSIYENDITVIKASSGQGKTTLALQISYKLQGEFSIYQLTWCNDRKEIGNILQYFKMRVRLGEKVLILIDNLNNHFNEWNHFAYQMKLNLLCNYKLLITTREADWYNYHGDLSSIRSLHIVKPVLTCLEAEEVFNRFKQNKQLHPKIKTWHDAWNKIAEKQLLIEYVYLLTHGEMLAERISSQMFEIVNSSTGKIKCEILREVCFADICGIKLSTRKLLKFINQNNTLNYDFNELLKSMEAEFLVHVNDRNGYIEGLHPIRSKHIVDRLHEFYPIEQTMLDVIRMTEKEDLSILFSCLPSFDFEIHSFFKDIIEELWNKNDLSNYVSAMQGLFSGSVLQYYFENKPQFDDAKRHGGLEFFVYDISPFINYQSFGISQNIFSDLRKINPDNKNFSYFCNLKSKVSSFDIHKTLIYVFCKFLYEKINNSEPMEIGDISSLSVISEWLFNLDPEFYLSNRISLTKIWNQPERYSLDCVSTLMYISFCGNRASYKEFVNNNLDCILAYLKHKTNSYELYVNKDLNNVYVKYRLKLKDIQTANEESFSRLRYICKTLPIFDTYCADALKPTLDLLSDSNYPDDAHKEIPLKNIVITFHRDLNSLWYKTIISNYEFDTVTEWMKYWIDLRNHLCMVMEKCCNCIYKILLGKPLGSLYRETRKSFLDLITITNAEKAYPMANRPFKEEKSIPKELQNIKSNYFQSLRNFANQFSSFLNKDPQMLHLTIINLRNAKSSLLSMQNFFNNVFSTNEYQNMNLTLCTNENNIINKLTACCVYFVTHSPNKYFNKYEINDWFNNYHLNQIGFIKQVLTHLCSKYSVIFPKDIYYEDSLSFYPIIIKELDFSSSSVLLESLIDSIPFVKGIFDILVILTTDHFNRIYPKALRIYKQILIELDESIKINTLNNNVIPPSLIDVTQEMLDCFEEKYECFKIKIDDSLTPISNIAEELWAYSTARELLSSPKDSVYLTESLNVIKLSIEKDFLLLSGKLSIKELEKLHDTCKKVYEGSSFDNTSYNDFINTFLYVHLDTNIEDLEL